MWYSLALFVHILGALGLFSAVSLMVMALVRMRRAATVEQIREWVTVAQFAGKSLTVVSLLILAPAIYMVVVAWTFTTPWILIALLLVLALAVMGATVNGRAIQRVGALARASAPGAISSALYAQLIARRLWLAEGMRLMLLVGIVSLMTLKPDLPLALIILAGMLVLGLILGLILGLMLGASARRSSGLRPHNEQFAEA